jgi:DNA helicase-2/ATP-dependent DNA helicase PcrA
MRFYADLHVHSKYSRATSRDLDLEHLAHWAARKGIGVVGTGDFCHPAWAAELKEKLVPAEPGLLRLREDIEKAVAATLPAACRTPVRFMLEVEISTIYKKADKTRKIHHLIYAPDFATADRISARLGQIGNIKSDGRPILGLDSRNLLEITLDSGPGAYLVPAHIWTPWFAALGSQSGFDSIADCYGDLSEHIFAVETGLSSDPPMNWRVSFLDRYRLTSNSDAHSPGKLGREATTFDCDLDYFALRRALETGAGYVGTVEFFPEEGKYHLDGHRKCEVRLTPKETLQHGGRCPVCGEKLTIGVEHRVEALADRAEILTPPATAGTVSNLVPLPEVLAEIAGSGVGSKTVERIYDRVIGALGSELAILGEIPVEDIARAESSVLAEAITRLRAGTVIREAGYDGEYGVIRLFEDGELKNLSGCMLFDAPAVRKKSAARATPAAAIRHPEVHDEAAPGATAAAPPSFEGDLQSPLQDDGHAGILASLDPDQRRAAEIAAGAVLILAGPGAGKTRTLTHRIAHLVGECGVAAAHCLAVTFTRRAAQEMRERLTTLLGDKASGIAMHTFHSLGLSILREYPAAAGLREGFRIASEDERVAVLRAAMDLSESKAETLLRTVSKTKRMQGPMSVETAYGLEIYRRALNARSWIDFDDCVGLSLRALSDHADLARHYRERFRFVSIDEFQDIDEQQYRLIAQLAPAPAHLCVIGDPDQAIYGFRGADASCFARLRRDYAPQEIRLQRNYRSSGTIVAASAQVIAAKDAASSIVRAMQERITIHVAPTERAEAEFVVQTIEGLIGGHSFFSIDSGRAGRANTNLSFADFAVLYRTDAQSAPLIEAMARSGIPFRKNGQDVLDPDDRVAVDAAPVVTQGEHVSLLTLHAAKGLEFRVVFVLGLEDGILPLRFGGEEPSPEERRLFYVGMTRAEDHLILTRAQQRRWRGKVQSLPPSPFLQGIESELLKVQRNDALRAKPQDRQLSLF